MKDSTIDPSPLSVFRFLGVVAVLLIHYSNNTGNFYSIISSPTMGGAIITFFYVLSGFGLFLTYQRQNSINLRRYFIKRTIRILPFYYMALLMMVLILLVSNRFSFKEFLLSFWGIQTWFPNYQHSINPPGWFVSNLLFFYSIFPIIFFGITRVNPDANKLLISSILLWVSTLIVLYNLLSGYPTKYFTYIECFPLAHFSSFYIGICGAYFVKENKTKYNWISNNSATYTLILFLLLCSLTLIIFYQANISNFIKINIPFGVGMILYAPILLLMIINLSTAKNYLTKMFSLRFLGLLGTISYPLYIFQTPFYNIYHHYISKPMKMQPGPDFIIFVMLIMLFSTVLTIIEIRLSKRYI